MPAVMGGCGRITGDGRAIGDEEVCWFTVTPRRGILGTMSAMRTTGPHQLREAYRRVMQRIGEAAQRRGRTAEDVLMVAVTTTASPDEIRTLVEMGHGDFGETRVQQLGQRVAALEEFLGRRRFLSRGQTVDLPEIRWHMVGNIPRNKVRQVVPLVRLIHCVDNLRLAEELHALGARQSDREPDEKPIEVLLQVNATGLEHHGGLALPAVMHVAEQVDSMLHLRLRGLMTDAPAGASPDETRALFARTAELFEETRILKYAGPNFNILSMGQSNDFEIAVEEGANIVRIGRAIFGESEG